MGSVWSPAAVGHVGLQRHSMGHGLSSSISRWAGLRQTRVDAAVPGAVPGIPPSHAASCVRHIPLSS